MANTIFEQIEELIKNNKVVLFMKGTPEAPMCGFSGLVVQVLKTYGVEFVGINVMEDPEMRQGIKDYTDWPTIPQLYVNQEFVGGCDIVKEMHSTGELKTLFN